METLLSLSLALIAGLMLSRLAKLAGLPAVTAYLIAGVVLGPYLIGAIGIEGLGFISSENVHSFSIISDVALGFIAFSIGNEFRLAELKKIGKQATVVGIFQAVVATLLVDAALIGIHFAMPDKLPLPAAIVLGAVASATAPAATLMVVRQYKAKGPLTNMLLPVVALDDAVGLMLFAISFGIAKALMSGAVDVISIIIEPIIEIVLSLVLGAVMGALITFFERFFHSRSKRLSMSVAFVMLTVALSTLKFEIGGVHIGFSSLLTCMMLGTVFCNMCDFSADIMERADRWTAPLFVLFFVLSGAELRLDILASVSVIAIGIVYILARSAGKYLGTFFSAKLVGCDKNTQKYLGITLLPQAGVALGMSTIALQTMGEEGVLVRNIVLFAVLVYELIGPLLTKIALTKSGDIQEKTTEGFDRKGFLEKQQNQK